MAKLDNMYMYMYTQKVGLKSQSDSTVSLKAKYRWKLFFKLQFNLGGGVTSLSKGNCT